MGDLDAARTDHVLPLVPGLQERLEAGVLYTVSTMHCMTVSLAAGGMGLGTCWGRQLAMKMLGEAGFGQVEIKRLSHDFQNDHYIVRHRASG